MLMTYLFTKYNSFIFDQLRKSKLSQRRPNWMVFASYCHGREMVMDDLTKKHQFEIWPTIMAEVGNDNFPPRRFLTSSQCGFWKTCVLRSHHQHILLSQSQLPSWGSVSVCVFISTSHFYQWLQQTDKQDHLRWIPVSNVWITLEHNDTLWMYLNWAIN